MDTIIDPEMLCSFSFCNHLSLSELEKVNHFVEDHGNFFKKVSDCLNGVKILEVNKPEVELDDESDNDFINILDIRNIITCLDDESDNKIFNIITRLDDESDDPGSSPSSYYCTEYY